MSAPAEQVEAIVRRVTGRTTGLDEPLGLDSLETVDLILALEEALGVHLGNEAPGTLREALRHAEEPRPPEPALGEGIGHLQWLAEAGIGRALDAFLRMEVEGREHVPAAGPVILASNHESFLDIPVLVVASPRPVWFMAKEELFASRFGAWFFHVLGGFSVDRAAADVRAVRAGLQVLEEDRVLGMYPEGTRSSAFLPFLPGAAWLALASGAPIVPVGVTGTADAMPRGSRRLRGGAVRVRFGEPLQEGREGDSRARVERAREVTAELRLRVGRLIGR